MEVVSETNNRESESSETSNTYQNVDRNSIQIYNFTPIGYIESMFKNKNGTPRQSGICNEMAARLVVDSKIFNNPEHTVDGLENFSHVWLLFIFHKNNNRYKKAKVRPPRLNGKAQGVFATRSPYRFNPVGLTLAHIIKIEGNTIYLSGVDIIDGTPVIDIKPFIEEYDNPKFHKFVSPARNKVCANSPVSRPQSFLQMEDCMLGSIPELNAESHCKRLVSEVKEPSWIKDANKNLTLIVRFTPSAEAQLLSLKRFQGSDEHFTGITFLNKLDSFKESIRQILAADPRSSYRRNKCQDRLYFVNVDFAKLTCWFDEDTNSVEILKVSDDVSS